MASFKVIKLLGGKELPPRKSKTYAYVLHTRRAVSCSPIATRDNLQITKFPGRQPRVLGWWNTQSCLHIIHTYLLLSELKFLSGTAAYQHPTFGSLNNEIESLFKCGECHKVCGK